MSPHGNPPKGNRPRIHSSATQPPTVISHQRHVGHSRKTQTRIAYAAVKVPMTIDSGNHATNPSTISQLRRRPKNAAPQTNPSMAAYDMRSTRRSAMKRGTGATNASGANPIGGNAAQVSTALSATSARGIMRQEHRLVP